MRTLRILTWHVHGSYLWYLARCGHELLLPVGDMVRHGYGGRTKSYAWPANVREIPAERVRETHVDVVLYQSRDNWTLDRHEILSESQRRGPQVFLEHDPPREHPTDTRHVVNDPDVLLVHVTPFNALMWDSGSTPTRVIDHGVEVPAGARATLELPRGVTVVNNLASRGRRLGADVFRAAEQRVPLDLYGMGFEEVGGTGELLHADLFAAMGRRRFFFNPIRYTSLGLAVLEAMALGMPIVGLATTEMVTAIRDGESGILDTRIEPLIDGMRALIADRGEAERMGRAARERALDRFHIDRFAREWSDTLLEVAGRTRARSTVSSVGR
jgi:glycosyltransferase involved in cell wall biosynthesis